MYNSIYYYYYKILRVNNEGRDFQSPCQTSIPHARNHATPCGRVGGFRGKVRTYRFILLTTLRRRTFLTPSPSHPDNNILWPSEPNFVPFSIPHWLGSEMMARSSLVRFSDFEPLRVQKGLLHKLSFLDSLISSGLDRSLSPGCLSCF